MEAEGDCQDLVLAADWVDWVVEVEGACQDWDPVSDWVASAVASAVGFQASEEADGPDALIESC